MKTVLQIILVAALFGGASAGGTIFWRKHQAELQSALQRAEAAEAKATENPLAALEKPPEPTTPAEPQSEEDVPELPVAVRPPYVEGADEASQLVVSLNQRLRATQEKEQRLFDRQEALKLIFADIRSEQVELNKLQRTIGEELNKSSESVRESLKAAQSERDLLRQELESLRTPPTKVDSNATDASPPTPADPTNANSADGANLENPKDAATSNPATLKRLGAIYDSMPSEVVAEVLQQLTKSGRESAAIQILQTMKDRQAAKVLGNIGAADAAQAASLTQKLQRP